MMVTWADMIGAVSGMNEKGLTVTINAAKSPVPFKAKTPVAILAREILQYAGDINQAIKISEKRKLFVSESLLISSATDGKAVIIEKSPKKYDVLMPEADQIVCVNHFQSSAFSNDKRNLENISGSDSRHRFERINELLAKKDKLNVFDAVTILRDRMGRGGTDPGMGNPKALNQLIAHHAVVFKPTNLLVWVSTNPYQLGKFVAYDLKKIFSGTISPDSLDMEIIESGLTIPADTFLYSREYSNYKKYLQMTGELGTYLRDRKTIPDSFETSYIETNPMLYLTYYNLGNYFYEIGYYKKAFDYYQLALSKDVAGEEERNKIIRQTKKAHKKQRNVHS
jgi:tetratricopeptide (TPR) repeat protein